MNKEPFNKQRHAVVEKEITVLIQYSYFNVYYLFLPNLFDCCFGSGVQDRLAGYQ